MFGRSTQGVWNFTPLKPKNEHETVKVNKFGNGNLWKLILKDFYVRSKNAEAAEDMIAKTSICSISSGGEWPRIGTLGFVQCGRAEIHQ